jgi:hypothetical protein
MCTHTVRRVSGPDLSYIRKTAESIAPHLRVGLLSFVDHLFRNVIHEDGGPLIHNGSEEEQRSFDSACRKLHRFLNQPQRCARQLPTESADEANL